MPSHAAPIINDERFKRSAENARWNEYDATIRKEVNFYNQKFAGVANFVLLDWRWVDAVGRLVNRKMF